MFFSSSSCWAIHVQGSMLYSLGRRARLSGESRILQIQASPTRYDSSIGPTHRCMDPSTGCYVYLSDCLAVAAATSCCYFSCVAYLSLRRPTVVVTATEGVSSYLPPAPRSTNIRAQILLADEACQLSESLSQIDAQFLPQMYR